MLISHKHKFVIINIEKTGTKSLRKSLKKLGIIDVIGEPLPISSQIKFRHHSNMNEVVEGFKEEGWNINRYFKFSVVRNPWDRYFSFFTYYKTRLKYYQETKEPLNDLNQTQKKNTLNFFNDRTNLQVLTALIKRFPQQRKYLTNSNGDVVMDKIGQLENISNDFDEFCESVGIIQTPKLPYENKSDNQSLIKKELYTEELIDVVAEKEKWVIDKFGYDFNLHKT